MNDLPLWIQISAALLLVASGLITVIGALGLLRLPTFYTRIHAPTLGNTMGAFLLLLACVLVGSHVEHRPILHPLIITVLLIITSPCTAMLLMRAAIRRDERKARELAQTIQQGAGKSGDEVIEAS